MSKKGQAAMEFLMTYGWALLVVLIAIAALAFFGLLNPSKFLPTKCEIAPGLTCMDYNAKTNNADESGGDYPNDVITILLNNGIGETIKLSEMNITDCSDGTPNTGINSTIGTIAEGETKKITVNCSGMVPETRFKSDIIFKYNTTIEDVSLSHSKSGYIVVDVEKI